jgi:hypothetical protein
MDDTQEVQIETIWFAAGLKKEALAVERTVPCTVDSALVHHGRVLLVDLATCGRVDVHTDAAPADSEH